MLINADSNRISNQIFNVGYENLSIMDIAEKVKKVVLEQFPEKTEINIETSPTDDLRSYHINSDKIFDILGFKPSLSVEDAIKSL